MSSKVPIAHNLSSKFRTEDVLLGDGNKTDFKSMILPPRIIDGLTKAGFVQPSPIQLKAIPLARCGFDLIVQSKSGTGKTCVFTVAALDSLNIESRRLQTLVLAPTREIANQIKFVIDAIGSQFPGLNVVPLIGGLPMQKDRERLIYGCHIVVGTPGRVRHCMELGLIELDAVRLFVLDEADMLMTPSFQADINEIYQQLPSSKQVLVCSATYTPDLISFLSNYMHNATYVTPSGGQCTVLLGLRHFVLVSPDESSNQLRKLASKENQLMSILKSVPFSQCLVFSNYQTRAESICEKLRRKGWRDCCEWIAGSQDQRKRNDVYEKVRDFKARILLTTDLTARGVDFEAVNLVINLDMPSDPHTYLHRMGRAGRFGGQGIVITLLTTDEIPKFRKLIGKIGSHANAHVIPDILLNKELWVAKLDALEIIEGDFESKEPDTVYSPMSETANEAKINPGSENDNVLEDDEDIKTTELLEFGLKLLRLRKAPEFCSFKKLEESRRNYVGDVSADKEVSKWRKVLEPPGSLDSDVAEYFLSTYSEKSADVTKICKFTSFVDAFKALPTKCDLNDRNFNIKQRESNIDDLNLDKLEISVGCSNKDVVSHSDGHKDDLFHRLDSPKSKFSSSRSSSSSSLHSSNSIENITDETSNLLLDARSIDHSGSRENKTKKPVHIFVPNRRSCEPSTSNTSDYRENRDSRYKNEFIGASSSSPPKRKLYKLNASSTSSENQQESYDNDESNVQSFHHYPQVGVRNTRTQRKRMRQTTSPPVQRNDPRMYSSYPNSNHHHSSHGPTSSIDQWNRLYHQQLSQIRMFTNYSYYLNYMLHFQDHHK